MKKPLWIVSGTTALLVGSFQPCLAQNYLPPTAAENIAQPTSHFQRSQPSRLCAPCAPGQGSSTSAPGSPGSPMSPVDPSNPNATSTPPSGQGDQLPTEGGYKSSFGLGTAVSAGVGVGASVASAAAGLPVPQGNARVATITTNSTPLILPGLFTAASTQTVMPIDRISFDYGYFNRFAVVNSAGVAPGFNLNQFNVSIEKTFFDGMVSVYASVPFLNATDNTTGQLINGLGDVNVGFKMLLYQNPDRGFFASAGMTVAAPTAHATTFTTSNSLALTFTGGAAAPPIGSLLPNGAPLQGPSASTRVNPTFIQPWAGVLWARDRFFVQEYFGVLIPTDDRISTIINNNVTFGYTLYSNPNRFITSFTPIVGVQMLLPVNHVNNSSGSTSSQIAVNIDCLTTTYAQVAAPLPQATTPDSFGFPDQVFISAGAQIGLGERAVFTGSVVTPVVGPRGYAVGGMIGLTYFY